MANFLTNLLFEPKGKHDPNKTYTIKDTVMSADASKVYFALQDVPAGISLDNTDYWILQIDLSASKNAMDTAAANARTQTDATIASANARVEDMMGKAAEAVTSVADYAAKVGMRVKGETKITKGNPMTIYPDGGSLLKPVTTIEVKQQGSGDPYPAGAKNLIPPLNESVTANGITFTPRADGKVDVNGARIDTDRNAVAYLMSGVGLPAGTYTLSGSAIDAISISIAIERASGAVDYFNADSGISRTFELDSGDKVSIYVQVYNFRDFNGSATVAPQLERGSVATGFEKYENIRPFIGYDKLDLNRVGKNLIGGWVQGAVNSKGEEFSSSTVIRSAITKVGEKNVFVTVPDGLGYFFVEYADGTFLSRTDRNTSQAFTLRDNTTHIRLCLVKNNGSAITPSEAVGYQVEYGTVGTEVEPYNGKLHTVQIGQTVYGGKFEWLTGKGVIEWGVYVFPDEENNAYYIHDVSGRGTGKALVLWLDDIVDAGDTLFTGTFSAEVFSDYGVSDLSELYKIKAWQAYHTSTALGIMVPADATAESVRAKLAGTKIVYKLATPIERQLAPNVITAIEDGGVNHIYGDADLTVEWVKPLETSLIEHSNAKVDANNEALLIDVAQKERSVGNPVVINDAVANVAFPHVETVFMPKQAGSGDPYPAGGGRNLIDISSCRARTLADRTVTINGEMVTVTSSALVYPQTQLVYLPNEFVLKAGTTYTLVITAAQNFAVRIGSEKITAGNTSRTFTVSADVITDHIALDATEGQSINATFGICLRADNVAEYAPYSNIRPITGYEDLSLHRTNENLCDSIFVRGTRSTNGVLATGDGYVCTTIKELIPVNPGMTLYLSTSIGRLNGYRYYFYNVKEELLITSTISNPEIGLTVPNDAAYFSMQYGSEDYTNHIGASLIVSLEPTVFVPYQGKLHTVQIGETVYGGRYNWLTGKLVAEWAMLVLDGNETWNAQKVADGTCRYETSITGHKRPLSASEYPELYCSHYRGVPTSWTWTSNNGVGFEYNKYVLNIYDNNHKEANISNWKAYLAAQKVAGTPVQVAYKLATPIEIQLDPTRITTIPGTNTIFGDGEFTIDWFKSYKKIAEEHENLLLDSFTNKVELSGNPIAMSPVGGLPFDGVVTEFSPKQEGSGDPYPAGGGKNLLVDVTVFDTVWLKGVISLTAGITYTLSVQETADALYFSNKGGTVDYATAYNAKHLTYTPETSGIHVLFARYANGADLAYNMMLEKGSAATEYAPPSNIRPITGYDALELNHAGKNLISYPYVHGDRTSNGITFTDNGDGSITINGTATDNVDYTLFNKVGYGFGIGESYSIKLHKVSGDVAGSGAAIYLNYYPKGSAKYASWATNISMGDVRTVVVPDDFESAISYILIRSGTTCTNLVVCPQIEKGTAASDWQPYTNTLHTVQLGQTVYGGRFDWLTGKLVAEWAYDVFDSAKTFRAWEQGYPHLFYRTLEEEPADWDVLCSHYAQHESYDKNGTYIIPHSKLFLINDIRFNSVDDFNAEIAAQSAAGTPVQIVYKLATPMEIQLDAHEILALQSINTLYGDGDTITAKFRQSKTISLEERLSALEAVFLNQ